MNSPTRTTSSLIEPVSESADRFIHVENQLCAIMEELVQEDLGIPPVKYECKRWLCYCFSILPFSSFVQKTEVSLRDIFRVSFPCYSQRGLRNIYKLTNLIKALISKVFTKKPTFSVTDLDHTADVQ